MIALKLNKTNGFRFFDQYSGLEKSLQTIYVSIADLHKFAVQNLQ